MARPRYADAPLPQPERHEPKLTDPGLTDLSRRDWVAIFIRAGKEALADDVPRIASALAYSAFLALPSILLVALGLFTLASGPDTIRELMDRLGTVMPSEATELLGDSLERLERQPSAGLLMVVVGLLLAVWSSTSAMTTYISALNTAYDRTDGRSFVKKRLVALTMVAAIGAAVLLVGFLLIFGPYVEHWLGSAVSLETPVAWLWWTLEWPLLAVGLLAAFAVLYYFGPDVQHRRWQLVTPGAAVALVVWVLASGGFAVYAGLFGSYNKTWGSLSAVIVTLTWLWLTSFALLFGGEVNAEVERSRELRQGAGDGATVRAPHRPDSRAK